VVRAGVSIGGRCSLLEHVAGLLRVATPILNECDVLLVPQLYLIHNHLEVVGTTNCPTVLCISVAVQCRRKLFCPFVEGVYLFKLAAARPVEHSLRKNELWLLWYMFSARRRLLWLRTTDGTTCGSCRRLVGIGPPQCSSRALKSGVIPKRLGSGQQGALTLGDCLPGERACVIMR
jgi:hypothetical protein